VLVICLNFLFIIIQTDTRMQNIHAAMPAMFSTVELLFTVYYVCELSALMMVHRWVFFFGEEMLWNWFDLTIVVVAMVEIVMTAFGSAKGSMSFLRVLRFLKVSRVMRMFNAMRIFKEIRLMVDSLMGSFVFFVWCAGMLALFLSLFAIFFVQGMATALEERTDMDDSLRKAIIRDFGSVSGATLTLLMSITGGNDWVEFYSTLKEVGTIYTYLYVFFILFSTIAFFNVITSVFCEKAMSLAMPDVEELMMTCERKKLHDAGELLAMLTTVLKDDARQLDVKKFQEFVSHHQVASYFELRGLNESTLHRFFKQLLEIHQASSVDFGTFASAFVKLDGTASSIDLHVLSAQVRAVSLAQVHLQESVNNCLMQSRIAGVPETWAATLSVATPCRRSQSPLRALVRAAADQELCDAIVGASPASRTQFSPAPLEKLVQDLRCALSQSRDVREDLTALTSDLREGLIRELTSLTSILRQDTRDSPRSPHEAEDGISSCGVDIADVSPDAAPRMMPTDNEASPLKVGWNFSI
jgi:hypothetical protein